MTKICNISFVIIARNEQFGIEKCLSSIADLELENCQIICVDSGSTDNTLKVMLSYQEKLSNYHVLKIEGYSNAAVARNAGIKRAEKKNIFFLDGDVQVDKTFLISGLNFLETSADCVTGKLKEFRYSKDYSKIEETIEDRFRLNKEELIYTSGGCFLVKHAVVSDIGLFNEHLERSQDYDYTLRISKKYKMAAIPYNMGIHHTIHYENPVRLIEHIRKLHPVFLGNVVANNYKHIKGLVWLFYRREKGVVMGFFFLILSFFLLLFVKKVALVLIPLIVFLDLFYGKIKQKKISYRLFLHYVAPVLIITGLFYHLDRVTAYKVSVMSETN